MSHIIDFTIEEILNPRGKNGLSSYAAYFQRLLYKEEVYPSVNYSPIDTWYDNVYFGRIDLIQNSIIPNLNRMSSVGDNLYAFDFVAEQFNEFVRRMAAALATGNCINTANGNPKIYNPRATRAYEDPRQKYSNLMNQIYDAFVNSLDPTTDKIRNFRDFVKFMVGFLLRICKQIPITMSNYVLGSQVGLFDTGLCIAIDNADMGDDNYKYRNWLTDPNYNFYVSLAKATGFIVNKNIPWVLTTDLFSSNVLETLSKRSDDSGNPITKENFFDHYYTKTFTLDIDLLKSFLVNSWKRFLVTRPFYEKKSFSDKCGKFVVDLLERSSVVDDAALNDRFMIDFYLALRSCEAGDPIAISDKIKNELYAVYNVRPRRMLSGILNSAFVINAIYRDYIYSDKYYLLNDSIEKDLDSTARPANMLTVGSLVQQIY